MTESPVLYGNLSDRQRQILQFIDDFIGRNGYAPSMLEIGAAVGLRSKSSVHRQLGVLQRRGYIWREPVKSRAMGLR